MVNTCSNYRTAMEINVCIHPHSYTLCWGCSEGNFSAITWKLFMVSSGWLGQRMSCGNSSSSGTHSRFLSHVNSLMSLEFGFHLCCAWNLSFLHECSSAVVVVILEVLVVPCTHKCPLMTVPHGLLREMPKILSFLFCIFEFHLSISQIYGRIP